MNVLLTNVWILLPFKLMIIVFFNQSKNRSWPLDLRHLLVFLPFFFVLVYLSDVVVKSVYGLFRYGSNISNIKKCQLNGREICHLSDLSLTCLFLAHVNWWWEDLGLYVYE